MSIAAILSIAAAPGGAQTAFDVASIRPTEHRIPYERDGKTEFAYGTLKMRDVTVVRCIHLAYGTPLALIQMPASYREERYNITAKSDPAATDEQMRLMMQALLQPGLLPRKEGTSRLFAGRCEERREDAGRRSGPDHVPREH